MLIEQTLFGEHNKIAISIARLQEFEPKPEGYYLAFSGGKDSCVIKQLAIESGVKFDAHYSVTTIDPPDLIKFIRTNHTDVIWDRPEKPFLIRLTEKGFPTRRGRWCCEEYKEGSGDGRFVITGIRKYESYGRSKRLMVESCKKNNGKVFINPIIDWTDDEVWEYINDRNLPYCSLYDDGFTRIGCLMCPLASKSSRLMEMRKYPGYEKAFRSAFRKLFHRRQLTGSESIKRWNNGDEMFDWWIGEMEPIPNEDQLTIFE